MGPTVRDAQAWIRGNAGIVHRALLESISPDDFRDLDEHVRTAFRAPQGGELRGIDDLSAQIDAARGSRFRTLAELAASMRRDVPSEHRVAAAMASAFSAPNDGRMAQLAMLMIAQDMVRRGIDGLQDLTGSRPSEINAALNDRGPASDVEDRSALTSGERSLLSRSASMADLDGDAFVEVVENSSARSDRADTASDTVERLIEFDREHGILEPGQSDPVGAATRIYDRVGEAVSEYAQILPDDLRAESVYEQADDAFGAAATLTQQSNGDENGSALDAVNRTASALGRVSEESRRSFLEHGTADEELVQQAGKEPGEEGKDDREDMEIDHGEHPPVETPRV